MDSGEQPTIGHDGWLAAIVCLLGNANPPTMSKSDYYVHIKRMSAPFQFKWEWRILRRSKDIDVGIYGAGFSTPEGARRSGKVALEKFLADPPLVPSNGGK